MAVRPATDKERGAWRRMVRHALQDLEAHLDAAKRRHYSDTRSEYIAGELAALRRVRASWLEHLEALGDEIDDGPPASAPVDPTPPTDPPPPPAEPDPGA